MLSCLPLRSVVETGQHLAVLQASSGSFQLFGWVVADPGSAVLVSGSCPCDPGAAALLHSLLRLGATTKAAVLAVVVPGYPKDHSDLLHVP